MPKQSHPQLISSPTPLSFPAASPHTQSFSRLPQPTPDSFRSPQSIIHERNMSLPSRRRAYLDDATAREDDRSDIESSLPAYQSFYEDATARGQFSPLTPPSHSRIFTHSPVSTIASPSWRARRNSGVTSISIRTSSDRVESHGECTRPPSTPVDSPRTNRHDQFYFTDDLTTFDVEGCLFRVHRSMLDSSTYFQDVFARNSGRGHADDSAIHLWGVTPTGFEVLLRYLYFGAHCDTSYTVSNWVDLLAVATDLSFPLIRDVVVSKLGSPELGLDAIERIILAEKYNIPEWLLQAYVTLCQRVDPLQESEAQSLGAKMTARIARAREEILMDTIRQYEREDVAGAMGNKLSEEIRNEYRVAQIVTKTLWPTRSHGSSPP
ncbi:hypothetical protein NM688_g2368 [Phlebia brevispora]|uniref:Uncharacterized protein n=1 Tax=Phlebia brevispora TaxID=194682 RepID=A0ACC1T8I3_9APHY|nr:hypothetical protein NM688_g2368 [Phlebia brevispora]